jgi:hypothetical protein
VLVNDQKRVADFSPLFALCEDLASTLYIGPFRNAINVGTKSDYFDVTVGQSFIETWRNWQTGHVRDQNRAIHQLTDSIAHIFGFNQLNISASSDNQTLRLVVNGRPYGLSDVGAGLAQFIVVLGNAAIKRPAYVLIDEPELSLHPSLQLDFLTTLGSYARRGVFFATHCYGLARARAQLVYTVRHAVDKGSEIRPLESTPRLSELLGELSFAAYKELGFDKILLVEGVTEVLTLQQWLRLYGKDHQVVLLPLGGAAMINGKREDELRVHALIDSERAAAGAVFGEGPERFRAELQQCRN